MSPVRKQSATGGRAKALTNILTNWGAFAVSAVISFFLAPFVVHSLGNEAYGVWILLSSLVGYLGLLDLGVRGAVTKFVAAHHAAARHDAASRIASAALAVFGIAGIIAILASGIMAGFGLHVFEISAAYENLAPQVLVLGGLTIAVTIVGGVFGGVVVARQRFDLLNASSILIAMIRAIAIVLTLRSGGGLLDLALVQLGVSVGQSLVSVLLSRWVYPELRVRPTTFTSEDLKKVLSFGIYASLLHVASALMLYSDSLVIGTFLPVELITFFAIATNLTDHARAVISGISTTITPMASALEGSDGIDRVREVLLTGARYATLISLPMVITFMFRGHTFIGLWMGPEYAQPAGDVLILLSVVLLVSSSFQICTATMIGLNKHPGMVPAFAVEAIANVRLSIGLISRFGIYGVAMGTLIPRLVVALAFGPWYVRRAVGTPIRRFLWLSLLRPGLSMIPFALASWIIDAFWATPNLIIFFAQIVVASPAALLGAWLVFLTREERHEYSTLIRQTLSASHSENVQ